MLRLIIGRSGSGKTERITEMLAEEAKMGENRLFLIIPEQYSFVSERALLRRLGPADANRIQVLSFTRLAQAVFREMGGLAGEMLDEGDRALLMSRALSEVAGMAADAGETILGAPPERLRDSGYVEQLLSLWEELRQCDVSTDALERTEQELEAGQTLQTKMRDVYRIYTAYEGLVAAAGQDELTLLDKLAEKLPASRLLAGAQVYVDGFKGFTAQELTVLRRILPQAATLTVALTADTLGRSFPGTTAADCRREASLFAPVTRTAERLRAMAEEEGIALETEILSENRRARSPELAALEAGLYAPAPEVFTQPAENVTLTPCADVYEECIWAARTARRLLREDGMRAREIAIVARNLEDYRGLLEDALQQAGVPYSMDERQEIASQPLMVYARTALRLAVGGWRTEELLRLIKTDLSFLSPLEIARLENYLYTWKIDGQAWEAPFTGHPDGFEHSATPNSTRRLEQLNEWRQQLIAPLSQLRQALRGEPTGREFAEAMYAFLTADPQLPQRVAAQTARLEEMAEPLLAEHTARLWDELMKILDRFALLLPDYGMTAKRLEELFSMQVGLVSLGQIPAGLDAVTVGAADRIRYTAPRAVLLLGVNEGVFPAYPKETGLLSEEERRQLRELGLSLADDILLQFLEERYFAYMAIAAPSEKLFLSWRADNEAAPSPLLSTVRRILPACSGEPAFRTDGTDVETAFEAFSRLAGEYSHPTPVTESLRQAVSACPEYAGRLRAVERAATQGAFRLEEPRTAQQLFHTELVLSASQIEKYHECPFSFFCRHGLQIKPRPVAQMDSRIFGSLIHYVMETLLPTYVGEGRLIEALKAEDAGRAGMEPQQAEQAEAALQQQLNDRLRADVSRAVERYLEEQLNGREGSAARLLYQLQLARRAALHILWHTVMELRQSAFTPVKYELAILPEPEEGRDGILSLRLPFDGGHVRLRGRIDRVDLFLRFDGEAFVRVVDYKTGAKTFRLDEVAAGLNTQMLLYLYTVCAQGQQALAQTGSLRPAGVLYHPLSDLAVKRTDKELVREQLKSMKMSGVLLDDPVVIQAMEQNAEQVFIPAGLDKSGAVKGSVLTAHQLELLRGVLERLVRRMAEELMAGNIDALPLIQDEQSSPCNRCDYRAICGREAESPSRSIEKGAMEAALAAAETEQEETAHATAELDRATEAQH